MRNAVAGCGLFGLVVVLTGGAMAPAAAELFGRNDHKAGRMLSYDGPRWHQARAGFTYEFAAQSLRPRVTIYPRRSYVGRNSIRQCRAALVKEYRISGPVIVPHERCWWE